jgi:Cu(I)/Ag(I) efflux system membrane protein CusA/SilA
VIYLEEAVGRKRKELGGAMTLEGLRDAVMEGALLRLRPKIMTVSTVIAGLLPIMWSTQTGADVMKPLAAPVLGGMVSSLLHVLIVTPVIFFLIQQRRLGLHESRESRAESKEQSPNSNGLWRAVAIGITAALVVGAGWVLWRSVAGQSRPGESVASGDIVRTIRSGDLDVVLRAPGGMLRQGRNTFTIEFRSPAGGALVDAGTVRASANMPMPGMVMSSGMQVEPTGTPGRYTGAADFGMAGAWQIAIEWEGAAGRGSVTFEGAVQ